MDVVVIDRRKLKYDDEFDAFRGKFRVGEQRFAGIVTVSEGHPERAWAVAEKAIDIVLNRFEKLEKVIHQKLSPELDNWIEKVMEADEVTRRVVEAMKRTLIIDVHADDDSANLYFKGPRFLLGHSVEVRISARGKVSVGLAG